VGNLFLLEVLITSAIRKNSNIVTFTNTKTSVRETLYLTPESHRKFKDIEKRRKIIIPMSIPPSKPCILLKEKLRILVKKYKKHAARQVLLYQLLKVKGTF